jgi:transmembrane sensor
MREQNMAVDETAQVRRDLWAMRNLPQYRALLGQPTFRERVVLAWRAPGSFVRWPAGVAVAGAACAMAVVAFNAWQGTGTRDGRARVETKMAEIRELTLPDGSRITLGAQSSVEYEFTATQRRVTLSGGDAFFSVAADASRPFVVNAGITSVRVLGTQFEVRRRDGRVSVAVTEGMVQVSHQSADVGAVLRRGESLVLNNSVSAQAQTLDPDEIAAWRSGRLVYEDAALSDVVADANRYFDGRIVIDDPKLADMRVTTAFRTTQVDAMVDTLERALPLTIERDEKGRILLRARR